MNPLVDESTTGLGRLLARARSLPAFRVDLGLALALFVAAMVELAVNAGDRSPARLTFVAFVLVILTLPLAWRRGHPGRVMGIVGFGGVLTIFIGTDLSFFGAFGILVALYSVVAHGAWRDAVAAGIVTGIVLAVIAAELIRDTGFQAAIGNVMIFGSAWVVGYAMRTRHQLTVELTARAEAAERAQVVEAERAVADERARIARELHDVIAHTVSVMVVQAGAARRVLQRDPARAADAIGRIETTGRDALTELRHMLSLLRDEEGVALQPQPRIGQLDELVATMEEAGVPISLSVDGPLDDLPAGVALSAYRIVQEALTNVLKHAGPTRAVAVEVSRRDDELAIAVRDDGQGAASGDGHGRGLIGLHERVALLDGTFRARPRRGGGFEVLATLPVEPTARPDRLSGGPA